MANDEPYNNQYWRDGNVAYCANDLINDMY